MATIIRKNAATVTQTTSSGYALRGMRSIDHAIRKTINITIDQYGKSTVKSFSLGNKGDNKVTLLDFNISSIINIENKWSEYDVRLFIHNPSLPKNRKNPITVLPVSDPAPDPKLIRFELQQNWFTNAGVYELIFGLVEKTTVDGNVVSGTEVFLSDVMQGVLTDTGIHSDFVDLIPTAQEIDNGANYADYVQKPHLTAILDDNTLVIDGINNVNQWDAYSTYLQLDGFPLQLEEFYLIYSIQSTNMYGIVKFNNTNDVFRTWLPKAWTSTNSSIKAWIIGTSAYQVGDTRESLVTYITNPFDFQAKTNFLVSDNWEATLLDSGELKLLDSDNSSLLVIPDNIGGSYQLKFSGSEVDDILSYVEQLREGGGGGNPDSCVTEEELAEAIANIDLSGVTNTYQDNINEPGKVVGDIAVVKTLIAGDKYSYTSYVWNGMSWTAMDGNYNADTIYIDSAITLAGDYDKIGNYKKGDTIAAGTSLSDILGKIFTKTLYPSKPIPSVSMSLENAGSYEVGSSITPSFKVTFSPKTYTYGSTNNTTDGSTTGAAPSGNATVTISGGANSSLAVTMSGNTGTASDSELAITDGMSYYGSDVSLGYTDGYMPVNNLNQGPEDDAEGKATLEAAQVKAGTATSSTDTSKITGFRYSFKYAGTDNTSAINDEWIFDTVKAVAANKVKDAAIGDIAVAEGDKRVMFAVPGTSKTLKEVKDIDGMGLDIKEKFTSTTVEVSGAVKGSNKTTYMVWYFENVNGFSKTTMSVSFN